MRHYILFFALLLVLLATTLAKEGANRADCEANPPYCVENNSAGERCNNEDLYYNALSCLESGRREGEKYAIVFSIDRSGSMAHKMLRTKTMQRFVRYLTDHFHNINEVDENQYSIYLWTEEGSPYQPEEIIWENGEDFVGTMNNILDNFKPNGTTSLDYGLDPTIKLFETLDKESLCVGCRRIVFFITDGDGLYTPQGIKEYAGDEANRFKSLEPRAQKLLSHNIEAFSLGIHVDRNDVYLVDELAAVSNGASIGSIDLPYDNYICSYLTQDHTGSVTIHSLSWSNWATKALPLWERTMSKVERNVAYYITNCKKPCPAGYSCFGDQAIPCPKGKYSVEGQSTCSECPWRDDDGYTGFMFTDVIGSKICRRCPYGTIAKKDRSGCDPIKSCPSGKRIIEPNPYRIDSYLWDGKCGSCNIGYYPEGNLNCRMCPEGTEAILPPSQCDSLETCCRACGSGWWSEPASIAKEHSSNAKHCEKCPTNLYRPEGGQDGCLMCTEFDKNDPNYYSVSSGSTACVHCPEDKPYVPNPGANCRSCPTQPSTVFNDHWKACVRDTCDAGFYSKNMDACIPCPLDSIAPEPNTMVCQKCPKGLWQNQPSKEHPIPNTFCEERCEAGTKFIQVAEGEPLKCEPCPAGTYQPVLDGKECLPCPVNHYADKSHTALCTPCAEGLGTHGKTGQSVCRSEDYWGGEYHATKKKENNPLLILGAVGGGIIIVGVALCYLTSKRRHRRNLYEKAENVFI